MSPDIFMHLAALIFKKSLSTHSLPNLQEVYLSRTFATLAIAIPATFGFVAICCSTTKTFLYFAVEL